MTKQRLQIETFQQNLPAASASNSPTSFYRPVLDENDILTNPIKQNDLNSENIPKEKLKAAVTSSAKEPQHSVPKCPECEKVRLEKERKMRAREKRREKENIRREKWRKQQKRIDEYYA